MPSQKMKDFTKLGFERSEGLHCQKILFFALNILKPAATKIESDLRLNSWVLALGKESCYQDRVKLEVELLGSCPWKRKLKPDAIPTIFSHKKAVPIHLTSRK